MALSTTTGRQDAGRAARGDLRATGRVLRDLVDHLDTLSTTELGFLNAVTAGAGAASKAVVLDSSGNFVMPAAGHFEFSNATPAAAGSSATDATAMTAQVNLVTGADDAKGVALPAAADNDMIYVANTSLTANLLVYPVNGGNDQINGLAEDAAFTMGPGKGAWFTATSATQWYVPDSAGVTATTTEVNRYIVNVDIADGSAEATYYAVCPHAGSIKKIWTVIDGVVGTADITVTANIGATPVTNGVVTITQSGSAAGDVDSATPTAANTVTAGQAVNFVVTGGGAGGSPRIHLYMEVER